MSTIDKLNTIEVSSILHALWIKYQVKWWTFSLYEGNKITSWWKASIDWKFNDFSEKWRAKWDRLEFIMQYLWCSKHDALNWCEDNFNIDNDFKIIDNPIKDKWESMWDLSQDQIDYLASRSIDYELLRWIVKNYKNNICMPIRNTDSTIKSLQSRSISEWWSRYYVESNTDSDGLFIDWINSDKKVLIVVEWFTDFISLRQYTTNVVWLLNAKNEWQIRMIKDLSINYSIYFIPDNDEAWQSTIDKFDKFWIKHNIFRLEHYWVKDINELLMNFWLWKDVLRVISTESERPPSNLQTALSKAKWYRDIYDNNWWKLWYPSGYPLLDKYTDGIIKWKVYMIMAYSNVGKTRFAYSFMKNMIKEWKKIHFYSLEVDTWMLFIEMIWAIHWWNKHEVLKRLDWLDIESLEEQIEIHDDIRTLEQIEKSILNDKPDVAFIDFVQNIELQGREYEKMTDIALRIQKLAILTWTTIIQLSQVSNESRFADGNNILPKGSGALFASSDVILTLWVRDWERFLTISKNKYWPAWINFLLNIDYSTSTFNMAEEVWDEVKWGGYKWI